MNTVRLETKVFFLTKKEKEKKENKWVQNIIR